MNRRNFLRGALALPFAGVGATERFLVGRYGTPAGVDEAALARGLAYASVGGMIAALPWMLSLMEKQVQRAKEPLMKDAIRALDEAVPCGELEEA